MDEGNFSISRFSIIQDNENYYAYRALNMADMEDIKKCKIIKDGKLYRIRTDRERWEENTNCKAKYSSESKISLEEVYDHIKIGYNRETNCISLSTDINVVKNYGKMYEQKYIKVKIPKKNSANVVNAGGYILSEIKKIIEAEYNNVNDSILNKLTEIKNANNFKQIKEVLTKTIKFKKTHSKYKGNSAIISNKTPLSKRFEKKNYFSIEQQLEYDKILVQLTILEFNNKLINIIKSTQDNISLIDTIDRAFSSLELIHYGEIKNEEFEEILIKV